MSSGDIDDILGPENGVAELRLKSVQLDTYLQYVDSRPILRAHIPFGAGISEDGQTVFIDSRLDLNLNGVDVSPALATRQPR